MNNEKRSFFTNVVKIKMLAFVMLLCSGCASTTPYQHKVDKYPSDKSGDFLYEIHTVIKVWQSDPRTKKMDNRCLDKLPEKMIVGILSQKDINQLYEDWGNIAEARINGFTQLWSGYYFVYLAQRSNPQEVRATLIWETLRAICVCQRLVDYSDINNYDTIPSYVFYDRDSVYLQVIRRLEL